MDLPDDTQSLRINGHHSISATSLAETTAEEQRSNLPGRPFRKSVSGNPAGRPIGSRHKLDAKFLEAICDDFCAHGAEANQRCRAEKPDAYLATIVRSYPGTRMLM